ncbi:MAG: alpha-1,2-fucosyltransferase [bacterium]|nr:alpha-1,2-fucosyltransferase [bacterium]
MIIVKLQGGLGNQMFQYAVGRQLAHIHNAELKLDISWFDNMEDNAAPREYKLKTLNITENIAANDEIKRLKKYEQKNGRKYILHNLLFADNSIYVKEKQSRFDENILKASDNIYLDGFWQSEKYFEDIKKIIRKEFTLKNSLSDCAKSFEAEIASKEAISIHVRRGDYVSDKHTNEWHGNCSIEYYNQVISPVYTEPVG